ncbi:hypothetical protein TIFTF001_032266 [Ficus carica]|uniref:Uncharacterized protein n=1 Tax=Ficus carica TaxID=3494 RepID=A0AA88DWW1_FICCA|nr:hypothetical protein TIFTF001_032266 [Ficus carica]
MGGGVMRAAAASKVAGIGGGSVVHGGFRGYQAAPAVEQALRKSPMPASAILSSSSSSSSAKATAADVAPIQRPAWEMDDLIMVAGEPMPRSVSLVFGSSFEELSLKQRVYLFSPESSESGELAATNQLSGLSLCPNHYSETKSCLAVETPNPALKAFKLLSRSTEAQLIICKCLPPSKMLVTVVASIASDPNVWNAVMQNPVLQDFMKSNQMTAESQEHVFPENFEKSSEGHVFSENFEKSAEGTEAGNSENWFKDMLENIKLTVVDLVSSLSSSLQNIFGFSSDVNADTKTTAMDITIGATFMGLATLVAMVVLLKRG